MKNEEWLRNIIRKTSANQGAVLHEVRPYSGGIRMLFVEYTLQKFEF